MSAAIANQHCWRSPVLTPQSQRSLLPPPAVLSLLSNVLLTSSNGYQPFTSLFQGRSLLPQISSQLFLISLSAAVSIISTGFALHLHASSRIVSILRLFLNSMSRNASILVFFFMSRLQYIPTYTTYYILILIKKSWSFWQISMQQVCTFGYTKKSKFDIENSDSKFVLTGVMQVGTYYVYNKYVYTEVLAKLYSCNIYRFIQSFWLVSNPKMEERRIWHSILPYFKIKWLQNQNLITNIEVIYVVTASLCKHLDSWTYILVFPYNYWMLNVVYPAMSYVYQLDIAGISATSIRCNPADLYLDMYK